MIWNEQEKAKPMKLTVAPDAVQTIVHVEENRLDAAIATRFKDAMREIILQGAKRITLDMSRVDFMDSSGLGAMIATHKAVPPGVVLTLSGLTPNVVRVFRLTRMDTVFTIDATMDGGQEKLA